MFSNIIPAVPSSGRPLCVLAVDAEEDFDWDRPVPSIEHSTHCMRSIGEFQEIASAYGAVPTYLLTYPVLQDDDAVRLLRRQIGRGQCDVGVQLHPWVNPPYDGEGSGPGTSFSGNLAPGLEERKLVALKQLFVERFGTPPLIYRAGRYGLGQGTADMLERHGFTIDTSLAPRTTTEEEGGPDYTRYDYKTFWFGQQRRLLEVPLCRSIVGWGGRWAAPVYRRLATPSLRRLHVPAVATRLRFAERITLSPEGNDVAAMLRLVRHLRAGGQTVFVMSFHSSSLAPGRNPYVRSRADLHGFYDRLSGALDALASQMQFSFARLADLPGHFRGAGS